MVRITGSRLIVAAVAALAAASPSAAQHIVCCNQLVDVGGKWVGADRSGTRCTAEVTRDLKVRQLVCKALQARNNVCTELVDICKDAGPPPAGEKGPAGSTTAPPPVIYAPGGGGGSAPPAVPPPPLRPLPPGRRAFLVHLDSAAGHDGRGASGVTLDSQGVVRAAPAHSTNRSASKCLVRLSPQELATFRQALATARPDAWNAGYDGPPDGVTRTLRYERREDDGREITSTTTWYEGAALPKELSRVAEIAAQALTRGLAACK